MTATDLLTDLQRQGFILSPLPGGRLEVRPASKLTDALCETIRQRKAEILAVLTHPVKQQDFGPCQRCGQTAWYEHMGFSLCGICTPQRDYGRTVQ